jgi:hypothetical protein
MKSKSTYVFVLAVLLIGSGAQSGGQERQQAASLALDKLELHNVKGEPVAHLGRTAMRVSDAGPRSLDDAGRLAVVTGSSFQDGTIEVNLTGDTAPDAVPFRVLLPAPKERASRGPIATKSFGAVHLYTRIWVAKAPDGHPRKV